MKRIAEICCGSLEDALIAQKAGADRIELNNAVYLGGLTPSMGTIKLTAENCNIPIVVMVRPRPGGFCYNDYEFKTMISDIEAMGNYNIEGFAFGCLDENRNIDKEKNKTIISTIHKYHKDAIFHRAFDCVKDPYETMKILIDLGVKRVLTSGLKPKAAEGANLLSELQHMYGDKIEILAGGGVNASNCSYLINKTGISQYHSSCRIWRADPTTVSNVSYAYTQSAHEECYEIVSYDKALEFIKAVREG
jgi:copper homeostasis protein